LILLDTSGVVAALFPNQNGHEMCARVLRDDPGPFVLSPFVLAEVDYLIAEYGSASGELAWLDEVAGGAYDLAPMTAKDVGEAAEVISQFEDLGIGLTDASIVVLSRRLRTTRLLSLDERHFRVLTGFRDEPFDFVAQDG